MEWAAPTGTQSCTVFSCKDFSGATALGMPESVERNRQIDLQAQQTSHLVCSLAGQRCFKAWGAFWTWKGQHIKALIVWREEEWREEVANIPPSEVGNDLCSTRKTFTLFQGQPCSDCWEIVPNVHRPFRVLQCHLEQKLKLQTLSKFTWAGCCVWCWDVSISEFQLVYKLFLFRKGNCYHGQLFFFHLSFTFAPSLFTQV